MTLVSITPKIQGIFVRSFCNSASRNIEGKAIIFSWESSTKFSLIPFQLDYFFGHQSVLCKGSNGDKFYASFWPNEEGSYGVYFAFNNINYAEGRFARNIFHDIDVEKKEPSNVILLQELNFEKMKASFETMQQMLKTNKMKFSFFTTRQATFVAHNCTSVVNSIVSAGGHPWKPTFHYGCTPRHQMNSYKTLGAESVCDEKIKASFIREAECVIPFYNPH